MQGGNAVDAAVAAFFTFSVTGGGMVTPFGAGFINLYTKDGQAITLDNYSIAPLAATPNMYTLLYPDDEEKQAKAGHVTVGNEHSTGFRSIGLPGNLKAWLWALKNFGSRKLSLREIMQPAMDYAKDGFRVTPGIASGLASAKSRCGAYQGWAEQYVDENGQTPPPETILKRSAYLVTLEALASAAPPGATFDEQLEAAGARFYKGDIAQNIVTYLQVNGGDITMQDLADYYGLGLNDMSGNQGLRLREPVIGNYRGYDIIAMPLGSSGGTVIVEMLNILEGFHLRGLGFGHPRTLHLMAEAMKIAWADRDAYMGDPDYANRLDDPCPYSPPPIEELISKEYAAERRKEIHPWKSGTYEPGQFDDEESQNTTSLTVADNEGNIIAMTQTQNGIYGSCVVLPGMVPGSGVELNNTMALFDPDPRCGYERANGIAPRKRMLSSMSPTIVLKDGKPFMAAGAAGGTRIFNAVMQTIMNVIDHRMNVQQAVEAPRIWTMMYGDLEVENGFPDAVVEQLANMGHSTKRVRGIAVTNAVLVDQKAGLLHGGMEWRTDGTAAGYSGGDALSSNLPYPPTWDIPKK
jgi:gamma-glutamyltranspeptidase/glutathione hydrolase